MCGRITVKRLLGALSLVAQSYDSRNDSCPEHQHAEEDKELRPGSGNQSGGLEGVCWVGYEE